MFTGIVEDLGEVEAVEHLGDFARIHVRSAVVTQDARPGDSICVNGVCLTVTVLLAEPPGSDRSALPPPRGFAADVMGETLKRSSLKSVAPGTKVNLERSVRLEDRLGGHLVQGHTDGTATILSRTRRSTGKSSASASRPAWPGTSCTRAPSPSTASASPSRRSGTTGSRSASSPRRSSAPRSASSSQARGQPGGRRDRQVRGEAARRCAVTCIAEPARRHRPRRRAGPRRAARRGRPGDQGHRGRPPCRRGRRRRQGERGRHRLRREQGHPGAARLHDPLRARA